MSTEELDIAQFGKILHKRDSLGRRNAGWSKSGPGKPSFLDKQNGRYNCVTTRLDNETKDELVKRSKKSKKPMSQLLREYIEWGLENDK